MPPLTLRYTPLLLPPLLSPPATATCYTPLTPTTATTSLTATAATIRDSRTGREWQRCSLGQQWDGSDCSGLAIHHTLSEAHHAATAASDGWRLPTAAELETLIQRHCFNPATDPTLFPATQSGLYWSTTPGDSPDSATAINFGNGMRNPYYPPSQRAFTRLIR